MGNKKRYLVREVYVNVSPKEQEDGYDYLSAVKLSDEEIQEGFREDGYYQHDEFTEEVHGSEDSYTARAYRYELTELTKSEYKLAKKVIKAYNMLNHMTFESGQETTEE